MTTAIRWNRLPNVLMVGILLAVLAFAFPAYHASAASLCQSFPGETTCTGVDPQVAGCDADAYTVVSAEIPGQLRAAVRYSPTCKSAWTRAVNLSTIVGTNITGQVQRTIGSNSSGNAVIAFYPNTTVLSRMVYIGNGASVRAIGTLQFSNGSVINQVQTNYVRP